MRQSGLRVFALVTDAFGGHGGIAQYNRDIFSALAGCDGVRDVIILPRIGTTSPDALPRGVQQLPPIRGRIAYSLAALQAMRKYAPVSVVFCGHLFMAPLAAALARLAHAPLWVQAHGIEAWHEASWLNRRSLEMATLITSVSRYTRRRLLEWAQINPDRVKVLPNTVDARYRPGPKPDRLLTRHAVANRKILLTVSRLSSAERYKGHDRVIRALSKLLPEHPDLLYFVVGAGDDRLRLEALAAECGVTKQVRFVGYVSPDELPDYFRLADVFVMPSTGEGFGIVFLEALATGLHVIAGNQDGSCDPLCDGALGTLVDPENGDDLALAIRTALAEAIPPDNRSARFGTDRFAGQVDELQKLFHSRPLGQAPQREVLPL
ncbi:MAG TPA: glycosyltransferase family 4 protein [Lacipirellulaceae bacterium]|jgi:phosphatidylinositol alpha-1,6-mannosyltransferase|nr:glycosyltransferase family 4 protein [Lacipirellulaceae bacterium]